MPPFMPSPYSTYKYGSPMYHMIRSKYTNFRHNMVKVNRLIEKNWSLSQLAWSGTPKFSYNPKLNQWVWMVDGGEWQGAGGRILGSFSYHFIFYGFFGFMIYYSYYRMMLNGKLDWMFQKKVEEE